MTKRKPRSSAHLVASVAAFAASLALPSVSHADHVAHRFEPTDLDLQPAGLLQLDLQSGLVKGPKAARLVAGDFEVNLGIAPNVEIDVDGAIGVEGPNSGAFRFDQVTIDDLWLSSKVGLASWHDEAKKSAWALGLQLGPKVPLAASAKGAGFESVILLGRSVRRVHLVFNAGGLVDPGVAVSKKRPAGVEAGADLNLDLNEGDTFSLLAEVGTVLYFSHEANQAAASLGIQWSPSEFLDLSLIGLVGCAGSDRYGAMLGISPKVRLFH